MKNYAGAWLPDDEADAVMMNAGPLYQVIKLRKAMQWTPNRRVALDIGAHCGLWSMQLAKEFERVVAFEPLERHVECFKRNTYAIELHQMVLGDKNGSCGINLVETLSGRSHIDGDGDYVMATLDDFEFPTVDFIKVDTEGFEYFVLKGAEKTLLRCKPTMIIEQKAGHAERYGIKDGDAIRYMESLGAVLRDEIIGDYVMSWGATQ